jgi:hypothetical protein
MAAHRVLPRDNRAHRLLDSEAQSPKEDVDRTMDQIGITRAGVDRAPAVPFIVTGERFFFSLRDSSI